MSLIDWVVLFGAIAAIVSYGTWKTRGNRTMEGYLKGDNSLKWWMIGVSIMATQASAVTFLSTPGQAIEDGMRFLQFYFGLPVAMVIISVTFVPIYLFLYKFEIGYMHLYFYFSIILLAIFLVLLCRSKTKLDYLIGHNILKFIILLGVFSILSIDVNLLLNRIL